MAVSRLRLRFAAWFAVAFLVGLVGFEAALYLSVGATVRRAFDRGLKTQTDGMARFLEGEVIEDSLLTPAEAVREGLREVRPAGTPAAVMDASGTIVALRGPEAIREWLRGRQPPQGVIEATLDDGKHRYRAAASRLNGAFRGTVVMLASTESIDEHLEALLRWMLVTAPVVVVGCAGAGYLLSRRAVAPMRALARAIDRLPAADRAARLPVGARADEIDDLAERFNRLVARLREAERQNQAFVADAAHQIRTPLTLVLGEAELALADEAPPGDTQAAMRRIQTAALQMKRRVDELFLLADSGAGAEFPVDQAVDLEGLCFDVADLMRARADATRHGLRLGPVDTPTVAGHRAMLHEALVELVENACRHAEPGSTITVSCRAAGATALLGVQSDGEPVPVQPVEPGKGRGIGLRIVRLIASRHGGGLVVTRDGRSNRVEMSLPLRTEG